MMLAKRRRIAPPDATVHAAVYEWCLDRIDPEHPLFHTSYFGQVVRPGVTAAQAVDARTREHRADATRDPKDLGLHWAIRTFGPAAFTVRTVDTTRLPRRDAMEWANRRETELIAAHGGVMVDREPDAPIRQTFNLTRGGQGDPTVVWQSIEARSELMWRRLQPYLQAFCDEHRHLRVPTSYVSPDYFKLGQLVHSIRAHHAYVKGHPDRLAWLQARGWVANERDAKWEDVQAHLQEFYDKHRHLRVPKCHVSPDDVKLEQLVHDIRAQDVYVKGHPDRLAWLQARGWVANERDAKWEDVQPYLQDFYDKHHHLRVPQRNVSSDGFKLGQLVNHIRARHDYVKGHPDRVAWLQARGFKMHARDPVKDAERWAACRVAV